jgi:hypothetical protein
MILIFVIFVIFRVILSVIAVGLGLLTGLLLLLMQSLHEIRVEHAMRVEHVAGDTESDVHANNVVLREFHVLCHLEGIGVGLLDGVETLAKGKGSWLI